MASISSIGVGSNLPLGELLDNIRKSENVALTRISDQQKLAQVRLDAYGVLKGSLEKLSEAAKALDKADTFNATTASATGDAFTVAGKSGAIAGRYEVEIQQLAKSQTLVAADGRADRTSSIGFGGVIAFEIGGETKTLDLTGRSTSLNDVMKAINTSDLGVQATVINDGSDAPHRLMLTTKETGTEAAISGISVSGNDELQQLLGYDSADTGAGSMRENVAAADARLTINDIEITSQSNTIEDVIEGVSITLKDVTDKAQTLTVAADPDTTTKAIKTFVDAYNALQGTIGSLTGYDAENQRSSALTGDSVARTIQSRARGIVDASVPGNAFANLAALGITTDPTDGGKLKIDNDKLNAALKDNGDAVAALFSGDGGIAKRADEIIKPMLESGRGLLAASTEGAKKQVTDLGKEFERTQDRIDATMERYRAQFVSLDAMVSQMNGISSYLTQQLSMLGNMNNSQK